MLTKFESKSNRVKGLAFHVSRPWVLSTLHNGVIQLWDYRIGTLLDKYDEHDGPIRGIDFHRSQPIFVSGGDDYKIKVWDYKLRRCLFTLLGHLDYIRTVQFHHEYPWIVSCSDDQTVRIWNWQSRSCVSVLTGHNHYVMCAAFHPKEDLVLSASLDQTIRVWDTTGLRKKTVRGAPPSALEQQMMRQGGPGSGTRDLFATNDAVVKYVLEGHDRGVNYAGFHPNLPLIVSGADDRQVKLWRMNDTKAWEVDTLRGHTNNVSSVLFHPRHELIISNSEDRSIRVWDISKRMGIQTFRRENDRFWILAAHPTQNLLAAGHDTGMIVFKLERERPALESCDGTCYYVKDRYLRALEFESGRDIPVATLRRQGVPGASAGNQSKTLSYNSYNPTEHNVLICSDSTSIEGGSAYELLTFSKDDSHSNHASSSSSSGQETQRGAAIAAVFIARNRFAILDAQKQLVIKNFANEVVKKITPPLGGTADCVFSAGTVGRVLLKMDDKMVLYETQSRRVLAEIQAPRVKYVHWSAESNYVAMCSKHSITIADRQLKVLSTITETVRIKSGVWGTCGNASIFVYTTLNHVKYALANGDQGIIRTLDVPVYLTALVTKEPRSQVHGQAQLHCIDREGLARVIVIDLTECHFKIALAKKQYKEVMRMVKHSRLCGRAIIAYLTSKGYPEVALHFVTDETTRFNLAISCGSLQVALNSAYELNESACWTRLGIAALAQGNIQIVEMAYQRNKDFEKLAFLYLLTGNRAKLGKMMKIAELREDVMGRFHTALYLGDIQERILILESVGQYALAYLAAKKHGLVAIEERLVSLMTELGQVIPEHVDSTGELMMPPVPLVRASSGQEDENWPRVPNTEPTLEQSAKMAEDEMNHDTTSQQHHHAREDQDIFGDSSSGHSAGQSLVVQSSSSLADESAGAEWDHDDLDLLGEDDIELEGGVHEEEDELAQALDRSLGLSTYVAAPVMGKSLRDSWIEHSSVAADHVASGSFDSAMRLLHRQIGIVNFGPLKPNFLKIHTSARAHLSTLDVFPALESYLQTTSPGSSSSRPHATLTLASLTQVLRLGYRAFTAAKFDDVVIHFRTMIQSIPLLSVSSPTEVQQVKDLVDICREYLLAHAIREATTEHTFEKSVSRHVELQAYFSHCRLESSHVLLTLKIAMTSAFKSNNYIAAASFCRRLLELDELGQEKYAKLKHMAKKVLQKSEKEARNQHQLKYQETKSFVMCGKSLEPLYRDDPKTLCPYCGTSYKIEYQGGVCDICQLSKVGEETIGLVVSAGN